MRKVFSMIFKTMMVAWAIVVTIGMIILGFISWFGWCMFEAVAGAGTPGYSPSWYCMWLF